MSQSLDRTADDAYRALLFDMLSNAPVWMSGAQCAGLQACDYESVLEACKTCPVLKQCQSWVNSHDIRVGVFAGELLEDRDIDSND